MKPTVLPLTKPLTEKQLKEREKERKEKAKAAKEKNKKKINTNYQKGKKPNGPEKTEGKPNPTESTIKKLAMVSAEDLSQPKPIYQEPIPIMGYRMAQPVAYAPQPTQYYVTQTPPQVPIAQPIYYQQVTQAPPIYTVQPQSQIYQMPAYYAQPQPIQTQVFAQPQPAQVLIQQPIQTQVPQQQLIMNPAYHY